VTCLLNQLVHWINFNFLFDKINSKLLQQQKKVTSHLKRIALSM